MSQTDVTEHFAATPARVWEVLADGHRYAEWVKGTKHIREVEPDWPAVGTSIHFTAGFGPLEHKDRTTVRASEIERKLELEVHAWPAGTARVALSIEPDGDGSRVTLAEHPLRGPAAWLHSALTAVVFRARNRVQISDLRKLAEAD
jgi:carbon monoxide dehydrogenase subunit G